MLNYKVERKGLLFIINAYFFDTKQYQVEGLSFGSKNDAQKVCDAIAEEVRSSKFTD